MTKFYLFSQESVRLETAPTGVVRPILERIGSSLGCSAPSIKDNVKAYYLRLTQNDQILPIFTGVGAVRNRTYRGSA